jgi:hypothetical protein
MRRTHPAASFLILAVVAVCTSFGWTGQKELVLDLTGTPEGTSPGVPGMSITGSTQPERKNDEYQLPIRVEALHATTTNNALLLELRLNNNGRGEFHLAKAVDGVATQSRGKIGRRTFMFGLIFYDPTETSPTTATAQVTFGSESDPSSWLNVPPGGTVLVKIKTRVPSALVQFANKHPDARSIELSAFCREYLLRDDRFEIQAWSKAATSSNRIALDLPREASRFSNRLQFIRRGQ